MASIGKVSTKINDQRHFVLLQYVIMAMSQNPSPLVFWIPPKDAGFDPHRFFGPPPLHLIFRGHRGITQGQTAREQRQAVGQQVVGRLLT